jgi:uncharacterized protein YbaR (Trm112 family)
MLGPELEDEYHARPGWVPRGRRPPRQRERPRNPMPLSHELLSILVCSVCKGDLAYEEGLQRLTCNACRLHYRIVDDIPVMLVEEAEKF